MVNIRISYAPRDRNNSIYSVDTVNIDNVSSRVSNSYGFVYILRFMIFCLNYIAIFVSNNES